MVQSQRFRIRHLVKGKQLIKHTKSMVQVPVTCGFPSPCYF